MQEVIAPRAAQIDADDQVPDDVFEALKPYMSLTIPQEYGGQGKGLIYDCLVIQELGAVCPALVTFIEVAQLFAHVCGQPIHEHVSNKLDEKIRSPKMYEAGNVQERYLFPLLLLLFTTATAALLASTGCIATISMGFAAYW